MEESILTKVCHPRLGEKGFTPSVRDPNPKKSTNRRKEEKDKTAGIREFGKVHTNITHKISTEMIMIKFWNLLIIWFYCLNKNLKLLQYILAQFFRKLKDNNTVNYMINNNNDIQYQGVTCVSGWWLCPATNKLMHCSRNAKKFELKKTGVQKNNRVRL